MEHYDLIVIGAGPGGYTAAAKAASLGKKTALIEKDDLGGTCLNRGCIPTKTLLHAAETLDSLKEGGLSGIEAELKKIDYSVLQQRKNDVITQLRNGIAMKMKKAKVEVIQGSAKIVGKHQVSVNGNILNTDKILIATGSIPALPPIEGLKNIQWMSSDQLLENDKPISHLAILGGGVIGCEFASLYASLGTKVTVIEALDRLLPGLDREIGISLAQLFKKRGIEVMSASRLEKIDEKGNLVLNTKKGEVSVSAEVLLIAVGRRPYSQDLFGPEFSVETDRGKIVVDEGFKTSEESIWAIGDAIGQIQLAHAASAQGVNAVMKMFEQKSVYNLNAIPSCIYVQPEIASVGMTLEEAKEKGINAISVKIPMGANGKSLLSNQERGFIKAIVDVNANEILGSSMMCARATDMISLFTQAINSKLKIQELSTVVYPHPTFSEAMGELIEAIEDKLNQLAEV